MVYGTRIGQGDTEQDHGIALILDLGLEDSCVYTLEE